MLKKEGHDHRIDIWSIGVLMFELLAGYSPFSAKSNQDLYQNIRKLKIHWPADMPPLAKNLISKILKLDPKERLSLDEILKHKWFQQTPIIKPLLENEYKNNKDLLMFHMLNKVTPDIELRINNFLGMEGITTTPGTDAPVNPEQAKKKSIMKQIQEKGASTHSTNNSIDMTKEQTDNLKMENAKLTKEINNLRTKINTMESELRGVKTENTKLKEVNTSSLQEQIQKLTSDLDRYKIMDKERLAVISELEEKNNSLRELNAKIQMLENDKEQQNKDFDNLKNKIKELNKQIEMKEMTTDYLNKKIDQITQEKEQLFCDYQKKIEVLQMKVLSNASEGDNENSLTGVIELLNESVGEMKSMFQKKFDIFIENFDEFKREYNNRDEKFTSILNEKSMLILEQIQKFSSTVVSDVQNAFKKVNTPNKEVKDQKTEWLNKQITELSGYKKKGLEYERKIAELTNQLTTMTTNYNTSEEKVKTLEKQIELLGKGK